MWTLERCVSCTSWDSVLFSSWQIFLRRRGRVFCSSENQQTTWKWCQVQQMETAPIVSHRNKGLGLVLLNVLLLFRQWSPINKLNYYLDWTFILNFAGDRDKDQILPYFKDQPNPLSSLLKWIIYFKSRRWGFQMLIRLTNHERILFRHLIIFLLGMISR